MSLLPLPIMSEGSTQTLPTPVASPEAIAYIITQVVLPPRLPQEDTFHVKHEEYLLQTVIESLFAFAQLVDRKYTASIHCAGRSLQNLKKLHAFGTDKIYIDDKQFDQALINFAQHDEYLPLWIRAQNAGVILRKVNDAVHFEVMELSPTNTAVMSSQGRLCRTFPGHTIAVPDYRVLNSEFRSTVVQTLTKMSHQTASGTFRKVKKRGEQHDEDRDTIDPMMVTQLFSAFLSSVGDQISVQGIYKKTRDDVQWLNARSPWRRSSLWLLIRVTLQLLLTRYDPAVQVNGDTYKNFMLFYVATVLRKSCVPGLSSDLIFSVSAKASRRCLKLDTSVNIQVAKFAWAMLQQADAYLKDRWSKIRAENSRVHDFAKLKNIDASRDTRMQLKDLDEFLRAIPSREQSGKVAEPEKTCPIYAYGFSPLSCFRESQDSSPVFQVIQLENWVTSHLDTWVEVHADDTNSCSELHFLMKEYHLKATQLYEGNPEAMSVMFLTLLELWVAIDKAATRNFKILDEYGVQIPLGLLETLLLPLKSQMQRLDAIEHYVQDRVARATFRSTDVFQAFGSRTSLPVRCFEVSPKLKQLKSIIETEAARLRQRKCRELAEKQADYKELMRLHDSTQCEYRDHYNELTQEWDSLHQSACAKCKYRKTAESIFIDVYEWPLPTNDDEAKNLVFELQLNPVFGHWRECTIFLLLEGLGFEHSRPKVPRARYPARQYEGLSRHFVPFDVYQRVELLSEDKPHVRTHRKQRTIMTVTESDICLSNGLGLHYFDSKFDCFIDEMTITPMVPDYCRYHLRQRSISLQQFLVRTHDIPNGPSPNTVIATQSDCPRHLYLEEYKGLASLPIGFRVQWQSILLQLASPIVDFSTSEAFFIISQCNWQAGPTADNTVLRGTHMIMNDGSFADRLLGELSGLINRIQNNWQAVNALSIAISIFNRVASLVTSDTTKKRSLEALAVARSVGDSWVDILKRKAHEATDDEQRNKFLNKAVFAALICADSFSLENDNLCKVLSSPLEASILLKNTIIIREGIIAIDPRTPSVSAFLLHRWQRLMVRSFPILSQEIFNAGNPCIDKALASVWPTYPSEGKWETLGEPYRHWLTKFIVPKDRGTGMKIHLSLLTGGLFVNGVPLNRLPRQYELDAGYRTLFGRSMIEVVPSSVRGMQFSAKDKFADHKLHFAMSTSFRILPEPCMLLRATYEDWTFELVPNQLLRGRFPVHFVEDYVHWYSIRDQSLEFRPRSTPWKHSKEHWRLCRTLGDEHWRLVKGEAALLDFQSPSVMELNKIFSPLEDPSYVHIIMNGVSRLDIELPRLHLGFWYQLGSETINSRQFRGMKISEVQDVDTLVGLENMMVLKSSESNKRDKILIPNGTASVIKSKGHVRVTVDKSRASKVEVYEVDKLLGRLVDNDSMQSKLFISHLHAVTSFCLPDPLTSSTGTETSLAILRSAAVRSFDQLSREDREMLLELEELTPKREFYPKHVREMQSVHFSKDLGFLAQHPAFCPTVRSLLRQAEMTQMLYPESKVTVQCLPEQFEFLLQRDKIRSAQFRTDGFGAECHTDLCDSVYASRDRGIMSMEMKWAHSLCRMVISGTFQLFIAHPGNLQGYLWEFLRANAYSDIQSSLGSSVPQFHYDGSLLLKVKERTALEFLRFFKILTSPQHRPHKFSFMIWLSTLSFAEDTNIPILQTIAGFFLHPGMNTIKIPEIQSFSVKTGYELSTPPLKEQLDSQKRPVHSTPEVHLQQIQRIGNEASKSLNNRRSRAYHSQCKVVLNAFVEELKKQWPCRTLMKPRPVSCASWDDYFNIDQAMQISSNYFRPRHDNYELFQYLGEISDALPRTVIPVPELLQGTVTPIVASSRAQGFIDHGELFSGLASPLGSAEIYLNPKISVACHDIMLPSLLPSLVEALEAKADSVFEKNYIVDLKSSIKALQGWRKEEQIRLNDSDLVDALIAHQKQCKTIVDYLSMFLTSIAIQSVQQKRNINLQGVGVDQSTSHWPRLSPGFFLKNLARHGWGRLSDHWKDLLVRYGVAITRLQQAERLLDSWKIRPILLNELKNPGHQNWSPREYPESLLLEIESGIMIRPVQEEIAAEMRKPNYDTNAVMQLNMGEGKSSVIVPIVAAALADGSRLVRVLVAKPQSKQMKQMLISKLGGMLDRRVYHAPFSRSLQLHKRDATDIKCLFHECMSSGGILLIQPEHALSFMLMGIESALTSKPKLSKALVTTQRFLDENSRDIIDESDENFSVKFELVYTMGLQRPVQYSPRRWICVQKILDIIRSIVLDVAQEFPSSLEIHSYQPGRFPRLRFLRKDAQDQVLHQVAAHICNTGLQGFPIARQPVDIRMAVLEYITNSEPSASTIDVVEDENEEGIWTKFGDMLLLLRGLIAGGVLAFCFAKKRWRVDYGLDEDRRPPTKLAIPFRAKDSATPRSEFSHPDVVIVLTSLSHYYYGLNKFDIGLSFRHLFKADNAEKEYQVWVANTSGLPSAYRHLAGVNLEDRYQCENFVFPHFAYSKGLIDYFLAHIVFTKEMKEFPHKLSASGWDIGKGKRHVTTGFSGTNDSRIVLPLSVEQLDLEEQKHTNALVLGYLLQPENSVALIPAPSARGTSNADVLINLVKEMDPSVRVILDVGAQILELDNRGVADRWLSVTSDREQTEAVVYFDEKDELTVLDRIGKVEPLQVSPYAKQLDLCLVFLDEAHTRGTDLRLPASYRAAVILGANLTKDRLVQACMRMRLLGKGQSVVFCVPEEIRMKIVEKIARPRSSEHFDITVSDILAWAVTETWSDAKYNIPLWEAQGRRFRQHQDLWAQRREDGATHLSQEMAEKFLEDEAMSLVKRYRPRTSSQSDSQGTKQIDPITERCKQFKGLKLSAAGLSEEQERELCPEMEEEREEFRPPAVEPARHRIHPDLSRFIKNGVVKWPSDGYAPAFQTLASTSAAALFDLAQFKKGLLATTDFATTINLSGIGQSGGSDSYHRSVQFILTGSKDCDAEIEHMMVISQYEANELFEDIRKSDFVALHLYAPRPNMAYRPLDSLDLYTVPEKLAGRSIPRRFIIELNLFAGQLYMNTFDEYIQVCKFLGLAWEPTKDGEIIAPDGFILKDSQGRIGGESGFTQSPVEFFKILCTRIRRHCESIDKTHMGRILDTQLLMPKDFEQQIVTNDCG
ncbi:hypothetical protein F5Y16DRAFT_328019 [Xylariaceae sp. FL0255]|nr:hypothetical protein F5Y16DRAFT_328019 [Xylariaceae sp. FL0255]